MNIHPLFVHFPIAFLTVYAIVEVVRAKKFLALSWLQNTKLVLLLVGVAGAFLALGTGDFGEREFAAARAIINVHETFATITTTIFCVLLVNYLITGIDTIWGTQITSTSFGKVWLYFVKILRVVFSGPVLVMLALAGLLAVTITGALGGAIVYGPDADPVVHFVYTIFF